MDRLDGGVWRYRAREHQIVSFLSSIGETSYLDATQYAERAGDLTASAEAYYALGLAEWHAQNPVEACEALMEALSWTS